MALFCLEEHMSLSAYALSRAIATDPQVIEILRVIDNDEWASGDAIYMPGLSPGMVEAGGLFDYVARKHSKGIPVVAISGSDGEGVDERSKPGDAWPGKSWYIEELTKRGVPKSRIVPLEGPQRHSRQETDALIEGAKKYGWDGVVMASVDYHRPRQILGCVKYMNQIGWKTPLYLPSIPFDWKAEMLGSQQREVSTGLLEALTDWNVKISKYQAVGHLASFEEFMSYIEWRKGE